MHFGLTGFEFGSRIVCIGCRMVGDFLVLWYFVGS